MYITQVWVTCAVRDIQRPNDFLKYVRVNQTGTDRFLCLAAQARTPQYLQQEQLLFGVCTRRKAWFTTVFFPMFLSITSNTYVQIVFIAKFCKYTALQSTAWVSDLRLVIVTINRIFSIQTKHTMQVRIYLAPSSLVRVSTKHC